MPIGHFEMSARARRIRAGLWKACLTQEYVYKSAFDARTGKQRIGEDEMRTRDASFEESVQIQRRLTREAVALGMAAKP